MRKQSLSVIMITAVLVMLFTSAACASINVVTTTTDLADIARTIGGNKVKVTSLAAGNQDIHFVELRPSMVNSLRSADLFVRVGMDLDNWAQALVDAARNRNIVHGAKGYVDASVGIKKLEVPTTKLDPSMGHIHIHGNPHYWLDPMNGKIIAHNILSGLIRISPKDEPFFRNNYSNFAKRIDQSVARWQRQLASAKGRNVVTYHKTWAYFFNRFGLKEFGTVEPKPGIPPSPSHANALIRRMNSANVNLIIIEPFYSKRFPQMIAGQTGANLVTVPTSVGGARGTDSYIGFFDHVVGELAKAVK